MGGILILCHCKLVHVLLLLLMHAIMHIIILWKKDVYLPAAQPTDRELGHMPGLRRGNYNQASRRTTRTMENNTSTQHP